MFGTTFVYKYNKFQYFELAVQFILLTYNSYEKASANICAYNLNILIFIAVFFNKTKQIDTQTHYGALPYIIIRTLL